MIYEAVRIIRDAKIEIDDAATLLGKDRASVEHLIEESRLTVVSRGGGVTTVSLLDVVNIRHEWWQAIGEMLLEFVAAFEDESLAMTLKELKSQGTARKSDAGKSRRPAKQCSTRNSPQQASD